MYMPTPVLLAAIGLLAALGPAAATPTPVPPAGQPGVAFERRTLPGGGQPFAVVTADINADGAPDILATNPETSAVSIYLGRGDGAFDARPPLPTGLLPRHLAVADFDRDGHLDLAVAANGANAVSLHRGAGDGSFAAPVALPAGSHPFELAAVDLTGDGAPEIVVALEAANQLGVLRNDGSGGFAPVTHVPVGRSPSAVAAADLDGDGDADVGVACWKSNELVILFNDGTGTLTRPLHVPSEGWGLYALVLTDVDGDGHRDLVWTDIKAQAILVAFGDGRGAFPRRARVPAGHGLRSVTVADLNGDRRLDLAASAQADDAVGLALARPDGGWQPAQTEAVGRQPRMIAAGDFDRDGRMDLVTTDTRANTLTVLLNRGATTIRLAATPTPVPTPPAYDQTTFNKPTNIALDGRGHLYVADQMHHRVARVDLATGAVTTVAGTGNPGGGGDGGPALAAQLQLPGGVAVAPDGTLYIADHGNNRIRRVDGDGIITTVAGTGAAGFSGDGGPAAAAQLNGPFAVVFDADGRLVIADFGNARIRRVERDGTIHTILGTGLPGYGGDGGAGTEAKITASTGLALHPSGDLLVCDQYNFRVRRLARDGTVTTVVGGGSAGPGDGGPATAAQLSFPASVAAAADGTIYVSDQDGGRVRKVTPDGVISTIAGTGDSGFSGDGGPGAQAHIWFPFGLAVDAGGTLYFADRYNHAIRAVDPQGIIRSVAGRPREQSWTEIAARVPTVGPTRPVQSTATPRVVWEHTVTGTGRNAPQALVADADGSATVAGELGRPGDWLVLRLDAGGHEQWRFTLGGSEAAVARALTRASDGRVVVAGDTMTLADDWDALVVALAADGREVWRRAFDGSGHQRVHAIAADAAGALYVAGEDDGHWQVTSLAADGTPRWTRRGGPGVARALAIAPDGTLVVAGNDRLFWRVEALAAADGTPRWEHTVPPATQMQDGAIAAAVAVDARGAVTVAGSWTGHGGRALRVERLDAAGTPQWAYVEPAPPAGAAHALALLPTGETVVAGSSGTGWVLAGLDAQGAPRWRAAGADGQQALALATAGPDAVLLAGTARAAGPAGAVAWRIARYALP